ncbi:MAG: hypothetical protein Fur002_08990 [Anaerolineales bacterium]
MTNAPFTPPEPRPSTPESARRTRTIWIGLISGFLFTVTLAAVLAFTPDQLSDIVLSLGLMIALALTSYLSAWLAWRGEVTRAGVTLLASLLLLSLSIPILAHGQGIAIGVIILILGVGISTASLPPRYIRYGNAATIAASVLVVALDQLLPDFGFPSQPIYTQVFAFVSSIIFLYIIVRQFNEFTLRAKLVVAFTGVTIIPLIVLGVYNNSVLSAKLEEESHSRLTTFSQSAANRYDNFFADGINVIRTEAKQNAFQEYLLLPPAQRPNSREKAIAEAALTALQRKDTIFIDSYAILDANGKNILDTSPEDLGRDESAHEYFTEVMKTGAPFASNAIFIEATEQSVYFSAPIKDPANRILGVLRAEYHIAILQSMARDIIANESDIVLSLVEKNTYLRLAYTGGRDELLKSYKIFDPAELAALQAEGKMPPGTSAEVSAGESPAIVQGLDNLNQTPFFEAYSDTLRANAINTGAYLTRQPWVALVRESKSASLLAVQEQTQSSVLLSLALSVVAILMALGAAEVLAAPLSKLTKVAEEIASGNMSARANISTLDEVGALADAFNRMTDQLNGALNSLEERVTARTLDLEIAQKQAVKRAEELQSISEISKIITGEQNLSSLLTLITRLVSERFGFYHTGIFLIDETRQFAALQAANSEGGKRMLARGHRLALGQGVVGYVAKLGAPRIALDVGQDAVYFKNPDMPKTRSEMAVPLKTRNRIIGVLDAQSEKPGAFTETDAKNLSILADQISIALENAQLFERTQQALTEIQALYQQNLKESWAAFGREENMAGYRQTLQGGAKVKQPIDNDEIRQALNRGVTMTFEPNEQRREAVMVAPIKLRGQAIGALQIKASTEDQQWTSDERNLVESISERLSIALENARLIQESQRQVIKQQTIRDMTEKISASINLKNVLQTAVEELGRALPGSEVELRLASESDASKPNSQENAP